MGVGSAKVILLTLYYYIKWKTWTTLINPLYYVLFFIFNNFIYSS